MENFYVIGCALSFCLGLSIRFANFLKFLTYSERYKLVGLMVHPFNGIEIRYWKRTKLTYILNVIGTTLFLTLNTLLSWLYIVFVIYAEIDALKNTTEAEKEYKYKLCRSNSSQEEVFRASLKRNHDVVTEHMIQEKIKEIKSAI